MIIPMRWRDVPGGVRVILSSGRVAHVLDRIDGAPGVVGLRNEHGVTSKTGTAVIQVDPDATVPVVFAELEAMIASLKVRFPKVEYLREE